MRSARGIPGGMRWPGVVVARGVVVALAACAVSAACTTGATSGPFDGLPLDGAFTIGTAAAVHVARDRAGVAHIVAESLADAAFVQGYVMAHDRLPQMDVLRRLGAGTLAELYGVSDPAVIDSDLELRMYRLAARARASWDTMRASSDASDARVVGLLEQFAAGVNAYAVDLQAGRWTLAPAIAASWDAAQLVAWSPTDSLVIAELDALAQTFSAPRELAATELYQGLRETYDLATDDPAASARRGLSRDLLRLAPIGRVSTLDGFPNVASDTGSRSDGRSRRAIASPAASPAADDTPVRPVVPRALLDDARALFGRVDPAGALGPHALFVDDGDRDGGRATAIVVRGGRVLLAGAPHAARSYPSALYPTHLVVTGADRVDLLGVTLPGVPGILLGTNGDVAWSTTASGHDLDDVYLEDIAPCAEGSCTAWRDPSGVPRPQPITTFSEDIQIGELGVIRGVTHATYETVAPHGVLLPAIDRASHALVPRTGSAALALRLPDDGAVALELRALFNLGRATSVADGVRALGDAIGSGRSWMLIDRAQHLAWTSHAALPIRAPAAYTWDPRTRQDALAPFFVLPGDGTADWLAGRTLAPRFVPHAIDPAQGYLVASGGDPVGATFDGAPLDEAIVDDDPLYAGALYGNGVRDAQVTRAILDRAAAEPGLAPGFTLDELAALHDDPRSQLGALLVPALLTAFERLDEAGPPDDVAPYLAALPDDDRARLVAARALFAGWTFATPLAPGDDRAAGDAAATALFHAWLTRFTALTLADELDQIGVPLDRLEDDQRARIIHAMLTDPRSFITSPATQQPILCDNTRAVGPDDSCTKVILQATVDAMTQLAARTGASDPRAWRWAPDHQLALTPVLPGFAAPAASALAGDDPLASAPALRWLAEASDQGITVKWALPGGVVFDPRSPHDHDQLAAYLAASYTAAPRTVEEIVAAGETRWVFH